MRLAMTNEELKTALIFETPVKCDGIEYRYIQAIIYTRGDRDKPKIAVQLMDKNKNSITTADPKKVKSIEPLPSFTGKAFGMRYKDEELQE